jgi:hypothetical protein
LFSAFRVLNLYRRCTESKKNIPITKLKESDVPASDAPWPVIESFALSLNGYKAIPNDKP